MLSQLNVKKYLNKYAEPEQQLLSTLPELEFEHCLVIPCYDENLKFIHRIDNAFAHNPTIVILVINRPTDSEECKHNKALFDFFRNNKQTIWENSCLSLYKSHTSDDLTWLVVDRDEQQRTIPSKQGVGLARKIGCDLAVKLFADRILKTHWIHCTDADTHLPENYFNLPEVNSFSVAIYSYKHTTNVSDSVISEATQTYERALHYYVNGLKWAGSPYAFHTIGSTMAYNIAAYCAARGFPKRSAGEDFYLINKLIKLGPAFEVEGCILNIESRLSQRVPFGTGPAVEKIIATARANQAYTYYSPEAFVQLKSWLDEIPKVWDALRSGNAPLSHLPTNSQKALEEAGIARVFGHIRKQCKTPEQSTKTLHEWFDAFQTLKFIRRLQEYQYPPLPLPECLALAPWRQ